jgi:hypothetical protein
MMAQKAEAKPPEPSLTDLIPEMAEPSGPPVDPRDAALEQFKSFRVGSLGQRMGPLDEFIRVKNLPADRVVTWATDPRIDQGRHLSFIRGLGFRPVEVDEVTTNPNVDDKLVVNQFDEGPHRMVCVGGGVLMIGYRQYRDERQKAQIEDMQARVDAKTGSLDDMGIEQHAKVTRAGLAEVLT